MMGVDNEFAKIHCFVKLPPLLDCPYTQRSVLNIFMTPLLVCFEFYPWVNPGKEYETLGVPYCSAKSTLDSRTTTSFKFANFKDGGWTFAKIPRVKFAKIDAKFV